MTIEEARERVIVLAKRRFGTHRPWYMNTDDLNHQLVRAVEDLRRAERTCVTPAPLSSDTGVTHDAGGVPSPARAQPDRV